jgi:hypothetical protein
MPARYQRRVHLKKSVHGRISTVSRTRVCSLEKSPNPHKRGDLPLCNPAAINFGVLWCGFGPRFLRASNVSLSSVASIGGRYTRYFARARFRPSHITPDM